MNLEFEKKKLEFRKIDTAKAEMEFKILERLADIDRLKQNIAVQDEALERVKIEMSNLEG